MKLTFHLGRLLVAVAELPLKAVIYLLQFADHLVEASDLASMLFLDAIDLSGEVNLPSIFLFEQLLNILRERLLLLL